MNIVKATLIIVASGAAIAGIGFLSQDSAKQSPETNAPAVTQGALEHQVAKVAIAPKEQGNRKGLTNTVLERLKASAGDLHESMESNKEEIQVLDQMIASKKFVERANAGDLSADEMKRFEGIMKRRDVLSMKLADQVLAQVKLEEEKEDELDRLAMQVDDEAELEDEELDL